MSLKSISHIDLIKAAVDIVEVVEYYNISLKKCGSTYKGFSPFNDEKTPSFHVSPKRQKFRDFSSGLGGDAIDFVVLIENVSKKEAKNILAERYRIKLPNKKLTVEDRKAIEREKTEKQLLNQNIEYVGDRLPKLLHWFDRQKMKWTSFDDMDETIVNDLIIGEYLLDEFLKKDNKSFDLDQAVNFIKKWELHFENLRQSKRQFSESQAV